MRIINRTERPVTVTGVRLVAPPGLVADYLGHTTCSRGCAGEGLWSDAKTRSLVETGLDGVLPARLDPGVNTTSFVFRLRVTDPAFASRLREGCWFRVREVELTLGDGTTQVATTPASGDERYVAGLHSVPDPPQAPSGCTPHRFP